MLDSFVVGVTPDGKRHPLFVGTPGEARSFADRAKAGGGVVEGTQYRSIRWSESVAPTYIMEFAVPALASVPGATAAVTFGASSAESTSFTASKGTEAAPASEPPKEPVIPQARPGRQQPKQKAQPAAPAVQATVDPEDTGI